MAKKSKKTQVVALPALRREKKEKLVTVDSILGDEDVLTAIDRLVKNRLEYTDILIVTTDRDGTTNSFGTMIPEKAYVELGKVQSIMLDIMRGYDLDDEEYGGLDDSDDPDDHDDNPDDRRRIKT